MSPPILTELRVNTLMLACLADEGKPAWNVEAVQGTYTFNLDALQANFAGIQELLAELPDEFRDTNEKAGAWSFLNAVEDRHGRRWASSHLIMEALFALGLGVVLVEFTRPREEWDALPGAFPYMTVLASKFVEAGDGC